MLPRVAFAVLTGLVAGCASQAPASDTTARDLAAMSDELHALRADRESDRRRIEALEAHLTALAHHGSVPSTLDIDSVAAREVAPASRKLPLVKLEPEQKDEGSIFIEDVSSHPSSPGPLPRAGKGGPSGGVDTAPPLPTDIPVGEGPVSQVDYEKGVAALAAGDAPSAEKLLARFVQASPRNPAADNALLSLGDAYVKDRKPGLALETWERIVRDYPAGDAVSRALIRYADTCRELGRKAAARAALERVIQDFPGSDAAVEARTGLAALGG